MPTGDGDQTSLPGPWDSPVPLLGTCLPSDPIFSTLPKQLHVSQPHRFTAGLAHPTPTL